MQEDTSDFSDPTHITIELQGTETPARIPNLELKQEDTYIKLIQNCYYGNISKPSVNEVIHFEIQIVSENAQGKINHVIFKADNANANEIIKECR